jgi:glycosyltransferase involved in cell wall biosynthesis
VNEAMCAGLPVVVGRTVGCAPDLVKEGRNGYLIAARDVCALAEVLKGLAQNASRRKEFGQESMRLINSWSFNEGRQGIFDAIQFVRNIDCRI